MLDTRGRAYARISDVKVGSKLECDGGFTCMKKGEVKVAYADAAGDLYIPCDGGAHGLAGQIKGKHYIGLYPV